MARPSYGPEAKKRSHQLFTVLLDYANDELNGDERALDALRLQIQTHWQTEQRLVVRTKVRFLEALTKLVNSPLTGEQIKEALRRFEDFLEILDDNRPNKGGSEVWHFTLNLWCRRNDRPANLRRFDLEWEQRRPQKSRQVTGKAAEEVEEVEEVEDAWWQLCYESLEAQQYQRLTSNPLTAIEGVSFNLSELYVPLELIERKRQADRSANQELPLDESEEAESDRLLSLAEFFDQLQSGQQRVAIVGEPGAGKTTLLQKIATWLLEQQALPIWISLADLQGTTLEHYLLNDWLKQATRKISVSSEFQEAFAQQFQQGKVWLLLDAIDEMAIDAATALSSLARQLRGWIADAHVILTCRSNVWDSGKNALDEFTTYCNLSFSSSDRNQEDQVGQFIDRWFQTQPELSNRLRQELSNPKRKRIKDSVKNPLRLALLCRSWLLTQGTLPDTKALLYQQFIETIYAWKQDRFSTTLSQRKQLNQALGQVALRALLQPEIRFRLPDSFAQMAFGESIEFMSLALQLGWLNQVAISTVTGEKIYAFYHPTFQEYFAAQAIDHWQFFFDSSHDFLIFNSNWREVILLWLGRTDIPATDKEAFIQALINFKDQCGGFYSYRAYFLAAAGLAEFPQSNQAEVILNQLIAWRFGIVPAPLRDRARVALLQTDRTLAITALEQFIQIAENPFVCWQAAYTLGKTLDPGNAIAITDLTQLIDVLHNETLRLQVVESLGKVDSGNLIVIHTLEEMLASTGQDAIRRRAAYSLGKIDRDHPKAIATLETLIHSTTNVILRLQTAKNLLTLDSKNEVAIAVLTSIEKESEKTSQRHRTKAKKTQDLNQLIAVLEQGLTTAKDAVNQRRIAYRLGTLQPGHPQAIDCLLQILVSKESPTLYKRVVEDLKEVLLNHQLLEVVSRLKELISADFSISTCDSSVQLHECYKLLWYCAQCLSYKNFSNAWSTI
jgi:hypothetical protein